MTARAAATRSGDDGREVVPAERSDALGIPTNSTTPPTSVSYSFFDKRLFSDSQKVKRFANVAVARSVLGETRIGKRGFADPVWRVVNCRKHLNFGKTEYEIHTSYNGVGDWKAWLGGVCICGSVHTCAVCAYTVGIKRSKELQGGIEKKGCGQAFMVATADHHRSNDAADTYKIIGDGLHHALGGEPYRRFCAKWKIIGYVPGWEWTGSLKNGHHPHKNILFLSELPSLDNPEFRADLEKIALRYKNFLKDHGYFVNSHTTDILTDKEDCADYMTKWALSLEVSQGNVKEAKKGHFTPFQLLHEIGFADLDDRIKAGYIKLFREYAYASKGKRQLVISKKLREWLNLEEDKTDEELAKEGEDPSWILSLIKPEQFKPVFAKEKTGSIGRLLIAARDAHGDPAALWDYLAVTYGIQASEAQRNPMPSISFENDDVAGADPEPAFTDDQLEEAAIKFEESFHVDHEKKTSITTATRERIEASLKRAEARILEVTGSNPLV